MNLQLIKDIQCLGYKLIKYDTRGDNVSKEVYIFDKEIISLTITDKYYYFTCKVNQPPKDWEDIDNKDVDKLIQELQRFKTCYSNDLKSMQTIIKKYKLERI